jgi:hypothetical protein
VNNEELQILKRAAQTASPGPWRGDRIDGTVKYHLNDANGEPVISGDNGYNGFGILGDNDEHYLLTAHPAAILDLIAMVEAGNPASAAPVAAGTIDTPSIASPDFNALLQAVIFSGATDNDEKHADSWSGLEMHINQQLAAAYAKGRADAVRDYISTGGAATAPVSTVPTPQQLEDARGEGWIEGAGLMAKAYLEDVERAGAPVSAAEQAGTWRGGYSGSAPTAAPIGTAKPGDVAIMPLSSPAGGQELPVQGWEERHGEWQTETVRDAMEAEIAEWRALAMRQPQGDAPIDCRKIGGDLPVIISQRTADHALDAMLAADSAGKYRMMMADDRSFVMAGICELRAATEASRTKKAEKVPEKSERSGVTLLYSQWGAHNAGIEIAPSEDLKRMGIAFDSGSAVDGTATFRGCRNVPDVLPAYIKQAGKEAK